MTVQEALTATEKAREVTPPTPASGTTVPIIGECACPGSIHIDGCAHYVDVVLGASGPHPCVEVVWLDGSQRYQCGCGGFTAESVTEVNAHQRGV